MSQPEVTFEIKAKVMKAGRTLAEFDSEQSARTWIRQRRLENYIQLWTKEGETWVKR